MGFRKNRHEEEQRTIPEYLRRDFPYSPLVVSSTASPPPPLNVEPSSWAPSLAEEEVAVTATTLVSATTENEDSEGFEKDTSVTTETKESLPKTSKRNALVELSKSDKTTKSSSTPGKKKTSNTPKKD